jgi:hypothetical protein
MGEVIGDGFGRGTGLALSTLVTMNSSGCAQERETLRDEVHKPSPVFAPVEYNLGGEYYGCGDGILMPIIIE